MRERNDMIPAALYPRVSSDRQDVDLSAAAQMRALRDSAKRIGTVASPGLANGAQNTRIAAVRR